MVHTVFIHNWVKSTYHGVVLFYFFSVWLKYTVLLLCSASVPPWLIAWRGGKYAVISFSFLGPLWSSLSSHWWAQQSRSLKVPALSGMWRPAHIRISDSRVILREWKMESRGLRQLKGEHDSSHTDCHVWYRSGSLSPPCGLDYLSEIARERLKHPCTRRGINENIISVCFRVYFWGDDRSAFVLVVTKTFKIIFLKCFVTIFFKQVVVA